ncbi:MAG: hypothetical protein AB7U82_09825 [Blastocatellales bacterium]
MKKINVGRVLLGGLVAGLVLNIGEFLLNGVILANDMKADMETHRIQEPGATFFVNVTVATFVLGIVIVYLYAAIRPQFGAGPKTAICAGALAWFFVYVYTGVIYGSMGLFSLKPLLIGAVWGLVEFSLGAIAGAKLYKDAEG